MHRNYFYKKSLMELIGKILNEIMAAIVLAYFVICAGVAVLALKRFKSEYKKLIRPALVAGGSLFCILGTSQSGTPFSMALLIGGMAVPIAYGALFFPFGDSHEKKDAFLKQVAVWTLIIAFALGGVTALFNMSEAGLVGLLMDLGMAALGAFLSALAVWVAAVNLSEKDYCTECGYYGGIRCQQEEKLNLKVTEWDSEEWEETKKGDVTVSSSPHHKYHNRREEYTALMHMKCEHCGREFDIMEERNESNQIPLKYHNTH